MRIYTKILFAILPLTIVNFFVAVYITYYFSNSAIVEHVQAWMGTKMVEAFRAIEEQESLLREYGLEEIPASVAKAMLDAQTAISRIRVGELGYIFIVDNAGNIITHPDQWKQGSNLSSQPWYTHLGKDEVAFDGQLFGEKHLFMAATYSPWGWSIVVTDPKREVFKTVNRMTPYLISIAFMGTIVLVLLLMTVTRRILRPLQDLSFGVEKIGKGELLTRINVFARDEIGSLAERFNEMAEQLYLSHNELEYRVKERTRELSQVNEDLKRSMAEKESAVEAWRANERRIAAILRSSPVGIALLVDRQISWVNDAVLSTTGYEKEKLIGQELTVLFASTSECKKVLSLINDEEMTLEVVKVQTQLRKKDGRIIECSLQASHLDPSEPDKGVIFSVEDTTAAKVMEEKLQRAKKMEAIGTLAGGVAHDLNNILSGIVSYPELLLLEVKEQSPLRKPLETIKRSGERATAIVQDLLTMARRNVATPEVIDLHEIVEQQISGPEIEKILEVHQGVTIESRCESELRNIRGSSVHIAKCITNLISNAAEAMDAGGVVSIATLEVILESEYRGFEPVDPGHYIVLEVEDTGVGIAEEDVEHIFEPFFTKKQLGRSGTGLGMAVVWGTVKDHHGFIDVRSKESEGTLFRLFFPRTDDELTRKETSYSLDKLMGKKERILVVDDSALQREIALRILEKLDYTVAVVESGEEAVEFLHGNEVDLVVLDMIMRLGMDGLDTYRAIQRFRPEQKIIIASGFSETERVKKLQELSGCQYLQKPYSINSLGQIVAKAL